MNSNAVTRRDKKCDSFGRLLFLLMTIKAEDRRSPNAVVICVRETRQIMIYRLQEDAAEDELMTSDGARSETEVNQQLKTEIH